MDAVSEIKQKLDIIDVVGSYVQLKKSGRNYKGICPFHSEDTPSFMVSPELQIFKCFGCGEAGDIFGFIQRIEGVDFGSSLEKLADKAGVTLEKKDFDTHTKEKQQIYDANMLAAKFYNYLLTKHAMGRDGLDYVETKRKLLPVTVKEFIIGYAPMQGDVLYKFLKGKGVAEDVMVKAGLVLKKDYGDGYLDRFRGRVMFPFVGIDEKVIGFSGRTIFDKDPKYLNTNETLVFHKSAFLFALNKAKLAIKKQGAVFVEGPMDVISAHQAGFNNVVATSGTSITDMQLDVLARYSKDIIFCLDSDTAGVNAVFRAVDLAEKKDFNIKIAVLPEGVKDIDELAKKDSKALSAVFEKAVSAYDFFLASITKRHDKSSSEGKKMIIEELHPYFSRISNKVILDHYSGQIAGLLGIAKETVLEILSTSSTNLKVKPFIKETAVLSETPDLLKNPEYYLMALLLKSSFDRNYDLIRELDVDWFVSSDVVLFITLLKKQLEEYPQPDIASMTANTPETQKETLHELYMVEVSLEGEKLDLELVQVVNRIKKEAAKRKMYVLSEKIKLAELEHNQQEIAILTDLFNKLSKQLI